MRNREFVASPEGEIEEKWKLTEEDKDNAREEFRKQVDRQFDRNRREDQESVVSGELVISPSGKFDKRASWDRGLTHGCPWINTPDDLYGFFREFTENNKDLGVTFENDPEDRSIKYYIRPKNEPK